MPFRYIVSIQDDIFWVDRPVLDPTDPTNNLNYHAPSKPRIIPRSASSLFPRR